MPKARKIMQIPSNLREELNRRLRDSGYSGFVALSEWLKWLGHDIGKSAIHRYSAGLKEQDRAYGAFATGFQANTSDNTPSEILLELGALRVREHDLLKRLEEISHTKALGAGRSAS